MQYEIIGIGVRRGILYSICTYAYSMHYFIQSMMCVGNLSTNINLLNVKNVIAP